VAVAVKAQTSAEPFKLIDPTTSIPLSAFSAGEVETKGGFLFGLALPEKLDKNDYIGHIVIALPFNARAPQRPSQLIGKCR
jgi:hypothetical protein